jgi:hypothetical protein
VKYVDKACILVSEGPNEPCANDRGPSIRPVFQAFYTPLNIGSLSSGPGLRLTL